MCTSDSVVSHSLDANYATGENIIVVTREWVYPVNGHRVGVQKAKVRIADRRVEILV